MVTLTSTFFLFLRRTLTQGMPTKLESRFRLTYYMILNLLRVKQLTVQDMMKRSFAEYYQQKSAPEHEKRLDELQKKVTSLQEPDCHICCVDLKAYYMVWAELLQQKRTLKVHLFFYLNYHLFRLLIEIEGYIPISITLLYLKHIMKNILSLSLTKVSASYRHSCRLFNSIYLFDPF